MGLIRLTAEDIQRQEEAKKLNIEKLKLIRKVHPNEVTQQEISVLKELASTFNTSK